VTTDKKWDELTRDEKILRTVEIQGGVTRKGIAEALGLKKHKALHDQIEALVSRGFLVKDFYENLNGSYTFVYFIGRVSQ
jgi:predicted ArsR family transcriptional regulator